MKKIVLAAIGVALLSGCGGGSSPARFDAHDFHGVDVITEASVRVSQYCPASGTPQMGSIRHDTSSPDYDTVYVSYANGSALTVVSYEYSLFEDHSRTWYIACSADGLHGLDLDRALKTIS